MSLFVIVKETKTKKHILEFLEFYNFDDSPIHQNEAFL